MSEQFRLCFCALFFIQPNFFNYRIYLIAILLFASEIAYISAEISCMESPFAISSCSVLKKFDSKALLTEPLTKLSQSEPGLVADGVVLWSAGQCHHHLAGHVCGQLCGPLLGLALLGQ